MRVAMQKLGQLCLGGLVISFHVPPATLPGRWAWLTEGALHRPPDCTHAVSAKKVSPSPQELGETSPCPHLRDSL